MLTDQQPAQFDAIRAGLGQVAVVTRATLRLVPAPRQVRRFLLSYPDLATMLGDQRLLASQRRFEGIQGAVLAAPTGGWMFHIGLMLGRSSVTLPRRRQATLARDPRGWEVAVLVRCVHQGPRW